MARPPRTGGGSTNRSDRQENPNKPNKPPLSSSAAGRKKSDRSLGSDRSLSGAVDNMAANTYKVKSDLDSNATSLTERREVAALYYDRRVMAPLWMKVSTTPWTAMAKAAGGYGRLIDDTSVSHDAPAFMHIPQVMQHIPVTGMGGEFSGNNKPRPVVERDDTTISEDAPDWFRIKSVASWRVREKASPGPGIRKMVLGKEVIFEPIVETSGEPIDWSATTRRTSHRTSAAPESSRASARLSTGRASTGRTASARESGRGAVVTSGRMGSARVDGEARERMYKA